MIRGSIHIAQVLEPISAHSVSLIPKTPGCTEIPFFDRARPRRKSLDAALPLRYSSSHLTPLPFACGGGLRRGDGVCPYVCISGTYSTVYHSISGERRTGNVLVGKLHKRKPNMCEYVLYGLATVRPGGEGSVLYFLHMGWVSWRPVLPGPYDILRGREREERGALRPPA